MSWGPDASRSYVSLRVWGGGGVEGVVCVCVWALCHHCALSWGSHGCPYQKGNTLPDEWHNNGPPEAGCDRGGFYVSSVLIVFNLPIAPSQLTFHRLLLFSQISFPCTPHPNVLFMRAVTVHLSFQDAGNVNYMLRRMREYRGVVQVGMDAGALRMPRWKLSVSLGGDGADISRWSTARGKSMSPEHFGLNLCSWPPIFSECVLKSAPPEWSVLRANSLSLCLCVNVYQRLSWDIAGCLSLEASPRNKMCFQPLQKSCYMTGEEKGNELLFVFHLTLTMLPQSVLRSWLESCCCAMNNAAKHSYRRGRRVGSAYCETKIAKRGRPGGATIPSRDRSK